MSCSTSHHYVKSQLTLLPITFDVSSLTTDELYKFGSTHFVNARLKLLNTTVGKIIHQTADYYVAQMDLYEAFLEEELTVTVSVDAPTIVMCFVFEGNFDLSKDSCSAIPGHTPVAHCYVCRLKEGAYPKVLPSGNHKTLVLILKRDWLQSKRFHLGCLKPLFDEEVKEAAVLTLPCCRINAIMMRALKKLEINPGKNRAADTASYIQVEQLITQYHHLLATKKYLTSFVHLEKARDLIAFLKENFSLPVVKNMSEMASVFCMSEKSLARLGYIAFGTTIHEHVLKLRMAHGMKLLLFTDKPVSAVAKLSGYNDPFFFSKTFKKKFGHSPSEIYRPYLNILNNKSNGESGQNLL